MQNFDYNTVIKNFIQIVGMAYLYMLNIEYWIESLEPPTRVNKIQYK